MWDTHDDRPMESQIHVRVPAWMEQHPHYHSEYNSSMSESKATRLYMELGIIMYELQKTDLTDGRLSGQDDPFFDPPVANWDGVPGRYPDDGRLVCPNCANSSKYLFRHIREHDIDGIQCVYCSHTDEADKFVKALDGDSMYWGRPVNRGEWHLVDRDTRRTVCERYSEPLETSFAPSIDQRPGHICRGCWRSLLGKEYDPEDPST